MTTISNPIQKPKASKRSKVMSQAWSLKNKYGLSWRVALKWAWDIVKRGWSAVVTIEFAKKDGEVTKRIATNLKLKEAGDGSLSIQFWSMTDSSF